NQPIKEMVVASDLPDTLKEDLQNKLNITLSYQDETTFNAEYRSLCENLNDERFVQAFRRLLNYIEDTEKRSLDHLQPANIIQLDNYLSLDMYSKRNLELTETITKKVKNG